MHFTLQYKLLPTRRQHKALEAHLERERLLYNAALQERRDAWRLGQHRITLYDQMKSLTAIRAEDADFAAVAATMSRWTLRRLDDAFKGFFARAKARSGRAGYPRFRGKGRWSSFGFAEWSGIRLTGSGKAARAAIKGVAGVMRLNLHRPIPADAELCSAIVTRDIKGWTLSVQLEVTGTVVPHPQADAVIGIDAGILRLATLSDGTRIENPRIGREAASELRIAQRTLARRRKGSRSRRKQVERLRRLQRRVQNRRKTYAHQATARIGRDYGIIGVEKLQLRNMSRSAKGTLAEPGTNIRAKSGLNRSLLDAGLGRFRAYLVYKAARAGGRVIEVDPRGTSIRCSACGTNVPKTLRERTHRCACGCVMDRDLNAAVNVKMAVEAVVRLGSANVDRLAA